MEWWEDIYNRQIYFDLYEEADTRLAEQEVRQVVTLLHPQEWARILDLCCGYGRHSSQRWVETIQALWQGCKGYMLIVQSSDELAHFVQADHRQLLNYCKDRDVSQAEATLRSHLKRSEEYLLLHWSLTHEGRRN